MKKFYTIGHTIVLLLFQSPLIAQSENLKNKNSLKSFSPIELSIIKNSDAVLTSMEHIYTLKAVNKSDNTIDIKVLANNINCSDKEKLNIQFQQRIYRSELEVASNTLENITIQANSSVEFYVKLITAPNSILNSWNCTEVKAMGSNNNIISNSILIKSFIPDPNDFK